MPSDAKGRYHQGFLPQPKGLAGAVETQQAVTSAEIKLNLLM